MGSSIYSKIIGTGSYIPKVKMNADAFSNHVFYETYGKKLDRDNKEVTDKFEEITTIAERRYVTDEVVTSDIAYEAALKAIESSGIDIETLDHIIVAHNFGDIHPNSKSTDIVPSLASRVKFKLGIENPFTQAYDMLFGCPGWVQAMIQANYYIKSGDAKRVLVIGADILSRVCDPHDRDCLIYADGAGAVVLENTESESPTGIMAHITRSDTKEFAHMLFMAKSYNPNMKNIDDLYLKMNGRKLYMYALTTVPGAMKACLDKSNIDINDISKILIHQANGKMDEAILDRFYKLYDIDKAPEGVMPMTIKWLGNSSVATVPTLLDLILKGELDNQTIKKGQNIMFASVGAGMNINAIVYKF